MTTTKSDLFYDPFAERLEKPDAIDFKFSKEAKNLDKNGSSTAEDSQNEDEEDLDFNDFGDDFPSAPPIDILDRIKGYEMVSFDATSVPPPPLSAMPEDSGDGGDQPDGEKKEGQGEDGEGGERDDAKKSEKKIFMVQEIETKLTEQQARSALLTHISDHCCYGTSAAKNLRIKKMEYLPAYHYELQTFTEKRETAWTYASLRQNYDGVNYHVSSSAGGLPPPLPWEIEEDPAQPFKDEVRLVEVPRTESNKTCHRCRGTGGVVCRDCNGKGWCRCLHCHGDGYIHDSSGHKERCFYCQHSKNGHGQQDCGKCHAKGKVNCQTCDGHGQIRCYIQLSITWKVHTAEKIIERLELPSDLIRDVSGQVAFEEEGTRVMPVDLDAAFKGSGQDESQSALIKESSANLVCNHINSFSLDQKVIRQRHQVRIVPVTRVSYDWKNREHTYYVYGYENKVYLPNYPQKYCWGCQIM